MPKEIVVSHGPRLFDDSGREIPQDRQGLVQVGWNRDANYVQVASFARDPVTHDTVWDGFYVDLDRSGINQLIRNLRRARDQTFGRDE